ncbi:MAG: hypothetical protein Fur0021_14000 [Candidatus Promineifilaceae bacterium]
MKLTLFVDAHQDFFCNWLEDFTRDAPDYSFPTEKGRISIQRAIRTHTYGGSTLYMKMEGFYIVPTGEKTETAYPISEVIRFKIIPLTPSRIEVVAECGQPVMQEYFIHLLTQISRRWPQPPDITQQLAEARSAIQAALANIQESQANISSKINDLESQSLAQIKAAINQGRIEQGEMARLLDAIRRVIRYVQQDSQQYSKELVEQAIKAQDDVNSTLSVQEKLEFTLPLLPFFLNYKVELGTDSRIDLEALHSEVRQRWFTLKASTNS